MEPASVPDSMVFHYFGAVALIVFLVWAGMKRASRRKAPPSHQMVMVFRTVDNLGPGYCGGDNAWGGALCVDNAVTLEQAEIIRAAVWRYRSQCLDLPRDGDRFQLIDGALVKL